MHRCQNSAVGNDDSVVVGHQKINGGQQTRHLDLVEADDDDDCGVERGLLTELLTEAEAEVAYRTD